MNARTKKSAGRTGEMQAMLRNKNPPQRAEKSVRGPVFEGFEPHQHRVHLVPQVGDFF